MELKELIMNRPMWLTSSEREGSEHIVLSADISIERNLADYPFPSKASIFQKEEIFNKLKSAVVKSGLFGKEPLSIDLSEVSDIAKTLLFERDFFSINTVKSNGSRGLFATDQGALLLINGENHIRLSKQVDPSKIAQTWRELDTLDTTLGREVKYAFNSHNGFLLNRPEMSGIGLTITYTVHIPALVHTGALEQVLSGVAQLGMRSEGKFRSGGDAWGSLFLIQASIFTGDTEEELINNAEKILSSIVEQELKAREVLFKDAKMEMLDKIWRSYGVLRYARMVSVPQLINLTSTLRLGIERGVKVKELTLSHIDAMIASALQGSVALLMDGDASNGEELDIQRAEIIRTLLDT